MTRIDKFCDEAVRIAANDTHGYDQNDRDGNPNFDCSGLTYHCGIEAGYIDKSVLNGTHYTGTIIGHFTKAGFRCDEFDGNINDLERGDIMLRDTYPDGHVAIYIGNGQMVEASINELGTVTGGQSGDQTGHEIHVCAARPYASQGRPWTHILTAPQDNAKPTPTPTNNTELISILERALEIAKAL